MPDYDVLIAGAGPVGAALALALRDSGLALGVLDARAADVGSDDPRPLALSHGTRLVLERLGVWPLLAPATPIARIHVSQRGGFGRVELDAAEARLPALGYVLDYTRLASVVTEALRGGWCDVLNGTALGAVRAEADAVACNVETSAGSGRLTARLLVVADGGITASGETRIVDYRQTAITARVASTAAHGGVAYERFTPEGPLALLPYGAKLALVWTMAPERARQLAETPESGFLAELGQAFGGRLGRFTAVERRATFPLALKVARELTGPRLVRVGNAAQTLHPVAGQGVNVGLRDAWELATELKRCRREDIGAARLLERYAARRRLDRGGGVWFTHSLVRLFSSDLPPARLARGLGLVALGAMPPLKDFVVRRMTFGARG